MQDQTPPSIYPLVLCLFLAAGLCWQPATLWAQPKWEKIIDDGDPGYSETGNAWTDWKIGSAYNGDYRYLSHQDKGLPRVGTATWQVTVPHEGMYELHAHLRQTVNRTTNADYKLSDGNGKAYHVVLNQQALPTGWHKIGTYYWKAGQVSKITLDGTDDNESDEADAMRWRYTGTGGPPPPVDKCTVQPPGNYTLKRYAAQVTATGDWADAANAANAPDGQYASSPNVDAGEILTASGFQFCTPPGTFRITSVKLGIMAKMQYDSGPYKLIMYLEGAGQRFPFSQVQANWAYGDVTQTKAAWTIADLNALQLKAGLNSHPGGKRDSDAWVDAFVIEINYQVSQTTTCPQGQTACATTTGDQCVDLTTNAQHCSACGQTCDAGELCIASICQVKCPANTILCGTGQCVNTDNNAAHCGGCNKTCAAPNVCSQGQCSPNCASPTILCGKQCVNIQSDPNHCGGCDQPGQPTACKESEGCQAGVCQKSCAGGEVLCADDCIDPKTDARHCGACNVPCATGESCQQGKCAQQVVCQHQQLRCFDQCIDPQNDPRHCGLCGRQCQSWQACTAGECIGEPEGNSNPFQEFFIPTDAGTTSEGPIRTRQSCSCHNADQAGPWPLWSCLLVMIALLFGIRRR